MLKKDLRQTILCLHERKKSIREIGRMLKLSRNTIKAVLEQGADVPLKRRKNQESEIAPFLPDLFTRCLGNAVRIKEVLEAEYSVTIGYTMLKEYIRNAGLRGPLKRVGEYCFEPGHEMQHDTSPHWVLLGDKKLKVQCASLVLGYSRKLYMQYYPSFTRFEVKTFLKAAIEFMGGSCRRCIIDNTSVILSGGSGCHAVISPEMATFCRMYGFEFMAHRINHADRKGKIERPFFYIENNFLAGRTFKDWEDLNRQAKEWCLTVNGKEKRILGMSPDATFIQEKPYLVPLPEVLPSIYEHYQRLVDCQGYVNLDTNRYSAPEALIGKTVDVYKYPETVSFFYKHQEIAVHPRLSGKRYDRSQLPGHHSQNHKKQTHQAAVKMEADLRGHCTLLDQ
ncbi:MAG: IS21 family transposase, partial [Alphaproteobacteria bacterium]|nr:IS21 family transposase [Alphaproteobacteria bacterium]